MRPRVYFRWRPDPWRPSLELWGGIPIEILTDYPGRKPKPPRADRLATVYDFSEEQDPDRVSSGDEDGTVSRGGWHEVTLPSAHDRYTFSEDELVVRCQEARGRSVIVCGYCEAKLRSRNLQKLRTWFRSHDCITPYSLEHQLSISPAPGTAAYNWCIGR